MPVCGKCTESFCDQFIKGILLTRICNKCAVSTDFLTKTAAIELGARPQDLDNLGHHREHNPYYRHAAPTYLFLEEEVKYVAGIANKDREDKERARRSKAATQDQIKRARQDDREKCLQKRIRRVVSLTKTKSPTPGLVSGDFCSTGTKTPKISAAKLSKRVHLYQSLAAAQTPQRVNLFRFACDRGLYQIGRQQIEWRVDDLHHALDRVVLNEGHRILTFLSPTERLHALRSVGSMEDELHGLPVVTMSDAMYALCQHTVNKLEQMRATDPAKRKLVFGRNTKASWKDVYALLVGKIGPVIPDRIDYYGVPRVFDMLCGEPTSALKMTKMYDCLARLGITSFPRVLFDTLSAKYMYNHSLVDFESVEHILRVFRDKKVLGMKSHRPFDVLRDKMHFSVFGCGKSWEEAADEAAQTIDFSSGVCACGNPSAKLCVSNKCGLCCHKSSVVCSRHLKR